MLVLADLGLPLSSVAVHENGAQRPRRLVLRSRPSLSLFGGRRLKACPYCAEQIQDAAIKCRFCGSLLDTAEAKWREFRREYDALSEFEKTERQRQMSPEQLALLSDASIASHVQASAISPSQLSATPRASDEDIRIPSARSPERQAKVNSKNRAIARVGGPVLVIAGLVVLAAAALSRSSSPPHNLPNEPKAGAATEPKGVVPTANTASNSESDCKQSLSCWAEKHTVAASIYCRRVVERLAAHDFEWTDGFLEPKFSHYRWSNQSSGAVTYIGDKIKFQNGFGAWTRYVYECDFSPSGNVVLDVRGRPGSLPR